MSKSFIYSANTSTQAVAIGGVVNFGSIVHRFGCLGMSGGNVVTATPGYYDIDTNLTIAGTATGTATLTLYYNGVAIPGAVTSFPTTNATVTQVSIPAAVRARCCATGTITAVITGVAVDVRNAAIKVIKE